MSACARARVVFTDLSVAAGGSGLYVTVQKLDLDMKADVNEEPAPRSPQGNPSKPPTAAHTKEKQIRFQFVRLHRIVCCNASSVATRTYTFITV